jgi:hypothetical protein
MSVRWIRRPTGRRECAGALIAAGAVAVGVGAATFYVVRLLLSREPLGAAGLVGPRAVPSGEGAPEKEEGA